MWWQIHCGFLAKGVLGFIGSLDLSAMNKLILFISKLFRRYGRVNSTAVEQGRKIEEEESKIEQQEVKIAL